MTDRRSSRIVPRPETAHIEAMDAANPSATPTAASRTPLHVGAVGLIVRNLDLMSAYYRQMLGLAELERSKSGAKLGVGDVTLLELTQRPAALPDDIREAGLYHTAFLMPTRRDHARWIMHVAKNRIPITGASDHSVSEAIYLDDPEGNGIEVYNDRPRERWEYGGDGMIVMRTEPLDIEAIIAEIDPATASYPQAPEGLRIGHVHLRVGDIAQAETFYRDAIGLDVVRRRGGASFMSSAGYHHHIGANVWHSPGAGARNDERAGLDWVAMEINDQPTLDAIEQRLRAAGVALSRIPNGFTAADPWGTRIRFVRA